MHIDLLNEDFIKPFYLFGILFAFLKSSKSDLMKKIYLLSASLILTSVSISFGQNRESFTKAYEPIRAELQEWDPVRGDWLASSLEAMSFNEQVPDRPFPENFTPHQMLKMVPSSTRSNISNMSRQSRLDSENVNEWNNLRRYTSNFGCTPSSGRSYGDPHLVSFDGERFSFQTVGEFRMVKSESQNVEVQVRQRPQRDDFSLNTAIAMNVGGDRLCIYARDYPDADYSTPVRLNGLSVNLQGSTFFLPHGGTIRKSNRTYTIDFPTGEVVMVKMRNSGNSEFMDVSVQVIPCFANDYHGILGNANGSRRDDFNIRGRVSPPITFGGNDTDYIRKERQAYLAKDFADAHRITQTTSLFDYSIGMSTLSYTDRSFPRVYRDFNDLTPRQMDRARKTCQSSGVRGADMNGCIYDNAYLNIGPSREPVITDPTRGTVLKPVRENAPRNVNPIKPRTPKPNPKPVIRGGEQPVSPRTVPTPTPQPRPTITRPNRTSTPKPPVMKPRQTPTPRPVVKPRPISTPKPRPVARPKPTPRPTPTRPSAPKTTGSKKIGGR